MINEGNKRGMTKSMRDILEYLKLVFANNIPSIVPIVVVKVATEDESKREFLKLCRVFEVNISKLLRCKKLSNIMTKIGSNPTTSRSRKREVAKLFSLIYLSSHALI